MHRQHCNSGAEDQERPDPKQHCRRFERRSIEHEIAIARHHEIDDFPVGFAGRVWLLNVWASWCVACRVEHPVLNELARSKLVPMIGLNYKDEPGAAVRWLRERGDPYDVIAVDADGRVGIDWGVYGVPETFVVDKRGVIRHKHIGPVSPEDLRDEIVPLIERLQQEPA